MGLFNKLRGVLKSSAPTAADLRKALADAKQLQDDAVKDRAKLAGQRADMLLKTDAERSKWKSDLAEADEREADAAAFADALATRLAMAQTDEDQATRRRAYDEARAKVEAAVKLLRRDYALQAQKLLIILRTVAEAQLAADQANAFLPAEAVPIEDVEMTARGTAARPRQVLSSTIVDLWCRLGDARPLGSDMLSWAQSTGDGLGQLVVPTEMRGSATGAGNVEIERRRFRRVEFVPATDWVVPAPIFAELNIPGVFKPPMASPYAIEPADIIAAIDEALAVKSETTAPRSQIEYEPIQEPARAKPKVELADTSRSRFAASPAATRQTSRGGRR